MAEKGVSDKLDETFVAWARTALLANAGGYTSRGFCTVIALLLIFPISAGAQVFHRRLYEGNEFEYTMIAVESGNVRQVRYILDHESFFINDHDEHGSALLHKAVRAENEEMVHILLSHGARPGIAHLENGWTPLHYAAHRRHGGIAELLIDQGANVNARDHYGTTPLFLASSYRWETESEVLKALVQNGAELSIQDDAGNTPVHEAVSNPHALKILLQAGARVNTQNNSGDVPLHTAAEWCEPEAIELLVDRGANINVRNNAGLTPLDIARSQHDKRCYHQLVDYGAKSSEELADAGGFSLDRSSAFRGLFGERPGPADADEGKHDTSTQNVVVAKHREFWSKADRVVASTVSAGQASWRNLDDGLLTKYGVSGEAKSHLALGVMATAAFVLLAVMWLIARAGLKRELARLQKEIRSLEH